MDLIPDLVQYHPDHQAEDAMGALVASKYPTRLFLKAADHTYVECGAGATGWSCWGGKAGGTPFNTGTGSTKRADAIAEPNERAGITTYLVNGVCHQAANRILFPAKIQVSNARGYFLSRSIFGSYGKPSLFNHHAHVSGDLPACLGVPQKGGQSGGLSAAQAMSKQDILLLKNTSRSHDRLSPSQRPADPVAVLDWMKANVRLFEREVSLQFREKLDSGTMAKLKAAKVEVEMDHYQMSRAFLRGLLKAHDFVLAFNEMTMRFQDNCANTLSEGAYETMFAVRRDERLVLADPDAVDAAFGVGTAAKVYGTR
ncbi:hypothetical protein [Variovorax sp. AFSI2.2]|uniref:hypothetical protein n=1 Tax=Variovorax sp. AFSI2.2 TaxID=3384160 RepID=UPI003EBB91C6